MYRKIVESGPKTQEKFLKGVEVVDKIVGDTLGPAGRNRIVQQKYRSPWVINDGAELARRIVLDDVVEDLAAQTIIEVSMKTAETAGDGTTTSVVIASELVRTCMKKMLDGKKSILEGGAKVNPMKLWKEIQSEKDKAVEILKKNAKEVKDKDLDNIISTSLENLEYGKTLADLIKKIGKDGYISVEDNWATKYGISTDVVEGMKFLGSYASPYLATSSNLKEAIWEDSLVLVTNHKLETVNVFKDLIEKELMPAGIRKLVIIGGYSEGEAGFSRGFIEPVAKAMSVAAKGGDGLQILAVKAPTLTSEELHDVAIFCGANFIDKNLDIQLNTVKRAHLGYAKKVSVTEDEVNMFGGKGDTKARVDILKEQIELEKDAMFKEKKKRRLANLTSGIGIIRVGAQTETERSYLKEKLKDAVSAAKVALEEGYVAGGGMSFVQAAKELGEDSILFEALMAPHKRIISNAGGDLEIPKNIINPLKVDRLALENACSGAGMLITSDGAIAEEKMNYNDYLEKAFTKLIPRDDRDDWRDDENQDLGRGNVIN